MAVDGGGPSPSLSPSFCPSAHEEWAFHKSRLSSTGIIILLLLKTAKKCHGICINLNENWLVFVVWEAGEASPTPAGSSESD